MSMFDEGIPAKDPEIEYYCEHCKTGISEPLELYDLCRDETFLACTICELPVEIIKRVECEKC